MRLSITWKSCLEWLNSLPGKELRPFCWTQTGCILERPENKAKCKKTSIHNCRRKLFICNNHTTLSTYIKIRKVIEGSFVTKRSYNNKPRIRIRYRRIDLNKNIKVNTLWGRVT